MNILANYKQDAYIKRKAPKQSANNINGDM